MFALTMSAYAQRDIVKSLQTDVVGQGKVTIHQDDKITALVSGSSAANTVKAGEKKELKRQGYRVQVYAGGNSRDARVKAERTGREINSLFPGEPVYVHFYSPRWICRMGNYRTYEEAHQKLNAVKKLGYQSAIIVKGKITVPYLNPAPQTTTTDNP